jgi:hypothetical protein
MKMTMRYAHLSPAFLSAELSLLDPPKPDPAGLKSPTNEREGNKSKRARKKAKRLRRLVVAIRSARFY